MIPQENTAAQKKSVTTSLRDAGRNTGWSGFRNTLVFAESIPSRLEAIEAVLARLFHNLAPLHLTGERREELEIALREALTNAMRHGNGGELQKQVNLRCYVLSGSCLMFTVCDQGDGFDISQLPDPTRSENLHRECGRGIFLIRHFMDRVEFRRNGSELRLYKQL